MPNFLNIKNDIKILKIVNKTSKTLLNEEFWKFYVNSNY